MHQFVFKKTSFTSQCRIKSSLRYSFWMLPEDAAVQQERLWRRTKQGLFGSGPAGNAARTASETRAPSPDTTLPVPKADVPNPRGPSPRDDAGGSRLRQQVPESPRMGWNQPSGLRQWQGNERSPERRHEPNGLKQRSGRSGFQTGPPASSLPPHPHPKSCPSRAADTPSPRARASLPGPPPELLTQPGGPRNRHRHRRRHRPQSPRPSKDRCLPIDPQLPLPGCRTRNHFLPEPPRSTLSPPTTAATRWVGSPDFCSQRFPSLDALPGLLWSERLRPLLTVPTTAALSRARALSAAPPAGKKGLLWAFQVLGS